MNESAPMTREALDALRAEIADLEGRGRAEVAARIKTAREWGDLKENAEYHDAKDAQAHLETRILRLREKELNAQVVDPDARPAGVAAYGSAVTVRDESGAQRTYTLVSAVEADPAEGRISLESPVGQALRGTTPGDTVRVVLPRGERTLSVLDVA